jgi:Ser/Thr protein kinase RdoA (MazF antagonist)
MARLELRLRKEIVRRYGLLPVAAVAIHNGDEASVWRVQTTAGPAGPVVVRVGPAWRTTAEVAWVHDLLDYAAHTLDVAVAPLPARDGTTAFWWRGRPVALFPFVAGTALNREDTHLRREAARLLARVHNTLRRWPDPRPRPPAGPDAPSRWPRPPDPSALVDPELDAWHGAWSRGHVGTATPVHGDFYRRNILCQAGRIVGLIDWDEARLEASVREVAWAAWEFGKVDDGTHLDAGRARAFFEAYTGAGGDLPADLEADALPLIRWRLREEIRHALTAAARGAISADDHAYTSRQVEAFRLLRDHRWS